MALINPTSVNKRIGAIKSLPADVVALAETALTEGGQKQAAIELAAGDRGLRSIWGAPKAERKVTGRRRQSTWDAVPGGVGALARKPIGLQAIELDLPREELVHAGEPDLVSEGRLVHVATPVGTGRTAVHLLVYYGFPGARSGEQRAKEANEKAIAQVFRRAAAVKGTPTLVLGDFNDEPDTSPALAAVLATGQWHDLALLQAEK